MASCAVRQLTWAHWWNSDTRALLHSSSCKKGSFCRIVTSLRVCLGAIHTSRHAVLCTGHRDSKQLYFCWLISLLAGKCHCHLEICSELHNLKEKKNKKKNLSLGQVPWSRTELSKDVIFRPWRGELCSHHSVSVSISTGTATQQGHKIGGTSS